MENKGIHFQTIIYSIQTWLSRNIIYTQIMTRWISFNICWGFS